MKNIIEQEVGGILDDILEDYKKGRAVDKMDIYNQPDKAEIMDILDSLFSIVYPGFFRDKTHKIDPFFLEMGVVCTDYRSRDRILYQQVCNGAAV